MNPKLNDKIIRHGEILKQVFKLDKNKDPIALCKQLFRLENKAHKISEDYANGYIDDIDKYILPIEKSLDKILGYKKKGIPVFINTDPRGYALKVESSYAFKTQLPRDWGGFGLIAPDLRV
jgi:uncharacterized protein YwqG